MKKLETLLMKEHGLCEQDLSNQVCTRNENNGSAEGDDTVVVSTSRTANNEPQPEMLDWAEQQRGARNFCDSSILAEGDLGNQDMAMENTNQNHGRSVLLTFIDSV